jgi:heptosyltransferase-3
MNRILIVRTDRLGDVLLTTPVAAALREYFPQAKLIWLVRPYAAPLLEQSPDVDEVLSDAGSSVGALSGTLQERHFDAAIVAYPRWRTSWAVYRAGIPLRIGPASKPYSVLFNRRIWQHRSEGKKHEADYNLELLEPLGVPFKRFATKLVLSEEDRRKARERLQGRRVSFLQPLVFLHPGSGGSSGCWPLSHFMALGDLLQEQGCDVVVTAGPGETYQAAMIEQMRRTPTFLVAGSMDVREFAALLSWANVLVTNSTGPLHMAVALGVPTVSIYSPIPTCHPQRWGPYPAFIEGAANHKVFVAPEVGNGRDKREDMAAVSVEAVGREVKRLLP